MPRFTAGKGGGEARRRVGRLEEERAKREARSMEKLGGKRPREIAGEVVKKRQG